jgi:3-oxoacyl-[acyl-carrier-protein] synthase-1
VAVFIAAMGMACPVGLSAMSACAALRAGISAFHELPYFDTASQYVVGSVVPGLASDFESDERLIELLCMAIADCQRGATERWDRVALLVSLAEPERPAVGPAPADSVISRVAERLGHGFDPELSQVVRRGRTGCFHALRIARQLLHSQRSASCLVCGVDSYNNPQTLRWLERAWRLKTSENRDGVIPGEAAAAILVRRDPPESTAAVRIIGLGFGHESAHILNDDPLLGLGLTEATRKAIGDAGIEMHDIGLRLSDVTGEAYTFKEQSLMLARLLRVSVEDLPIWHCADAIGDTGAAAGCCQLVVAHQALAKGYAPGHSVACFTSSDLGGRAVAVVNLHK